MPVESHGLKGSAPRARTKAGRSITSGEHAALASAGERELANHHNRSGTTVQGWPSLLLGLPFIAFGVGLFLHGLGLLGRPRPEDAPGWVIAVAGGVFAAAGLLFAVHGAQGLARTRRFRAEQRRSPHDPWLWDYPWSASGAADGSGRRTTALFMFALVWFGILAPFHWILATGQAEGKTWLVALIVLVFDVVGAVVAGLAVYYLLRRLKYGVTRVRYARIPFHLGTDVEVELLPSTALSKLPSFQATLRCVQERYELRGSGEDRSQTVVCYERHAESQKLDASGLAGGEPVKIRFTLPEDPERFSTTLAARPPRYWELELTSEVPGIDYGATFLLPVYRKR